MSDFTSQDRASLLMAARLNNQRHIYVSDGPRYGNYNNYGNYSDYYSQQVIIFEDDDNDYEQRKKDLQTITDAGKSIGNDIADLIRTIGANRNKTSNVDTTSNKNVEINNAEPAKKDVELPDASKEAKIKENAEKEKKVIEKNNNKDISKTEDVNISKDNTVKETEKASSSAPKPSVDLDDLARKARAANKLFLSDTTNLDNHKAAIQAYNDWATAVTDKDNNASKDQIKDCMRSIKYLSENNSRSEVSDLVDNSKSLLVKLRQM